MDKPQSPEWEMFKRQPQDQEMNFDNVNSRYDSSLDLASHEPSLIG
jgi:hypothetical protein